MKTKTTHHVGQRNYVNYEATSGMSPYQPKPLHGNPGGGGRNGRNAVPDEGVLHL